MAESEYLHKSHNVSVLLYHVVCTAKYRRVVFSEHVDEIVREVCLGIAERYDMSFLEIGTDRNHMHFLIQFSADVQSDEDCPDAQESDGAARICAGTGGQEAAVGRRILGKRIFYDDRGATWE
jgi:hypothetical protein